MKNEESTANTQPQNLGRAERALRSRSLKYLDKISLTLIHLDQACKSLSSAYVVADGTDREMETKDLSTRLQAVRNDVASLVSTVKAQTPAVGA